MGRTRRMTDANADYDCRCLFWGNDDVRNAHKGIGWNGLGRHTRRGGSLFCSDGLIERWSHVKLVVDTKHLHYIVQ